MGDLWERYGMLLAAALCVDGLRCWRLLGYALYLERASEDIE